jgi:arylsulfatase A-like enzyme
MSRLWPSWCLLLVGLVSTATAAERPNVVWIVVEDMSCHFGYQGEELVKTPHVDRLAREGLDFSNAYVTAPVCSTSRSAMITGMYQTSIGAHHHRSSRGELKVYLPDELRTIPELFRAAGYYTCNAAFQGAQPDRFDRFGKEDYNFVYDRKALYDGPDWSGRKAGQPFFAQIQLRGGKLRNGESSYREVVAGLDDLVGPEQVTLPPYYPDHPVFRQDWAEYLNAVQYTDKEVGLILDRLRADGLLENTVIFFLTDHGISHARGKQFLYDEGAKVPLLVWGPKQVPTGERSELVAHIDIAATSLWLAGIEIPERTQGQTLLGPEAVARSFVVSARDRCDETVDHMRSVREGDFKYIRNYLPQRPYLQPCAYKDTKPFMQPLRQLYAAGRLNKAQALHLAETRPAEELYDLRSDPFEIHNLANEPAYQAKLAELRERLGQWEDATEDQGRIPESPEMYASDMQVYIDGQRRMPEHAAEIEANIALMNQWRAEGK